MPPEQSVVKQAKPKRYLMRVSPKVILKLLFLQGPRFHLTRFLSSSVYTPAIGGQGSKPDEEASIHGVWYDHEKDMLCLVLESEQDGFLVAEGCAIPQRDLALEITDLDYETPEQLQEILQHQEFGEGFQEWLQGMGMDLVELNRKGRLTFSDAH